MLLEYFQMIDKIDTLDLAQGKIHATALVPTTSPVFEGHFPGMPLVPGVLLIETMAQASGFLLLAAKDFEAMPFLMSVDGVKLRSFVEPETRLSVEAGLVHDGSGYAVMKASIRKNDERVCDGQLKLRTVAFSQVPIGDAVRARAHEVGLFAALKEPVDGKHP